MRAIMVFWSESASSSEMVSSWLTSVKAKFTLFLPVQSLELSRNIESTEISCIHGWSAVICRAISPVRVSSSTTKLSSRLIVWNREMGWNTLSLSPRRRRIASYSISKYSAPECVSYASVTPGCTCPNLAMIASPILYAPLMPGWRNGSIEPSSWWSGGTNPRASSRYHSISRFIFPRFPHCMTQASIFCSVNGSAFISERSSVTVILRSPSLVYTLPISKNLRSSSCLLLSRMFSRSLPASVCRI